MNTHQSTKMITNDTKKQIQKFCGNNLAQWNNQPNDTRSTAKNIQQNRRVI